VFLTLSPSDAVVVKVASASFKRFPVAPELSVVPEALTSTKLRLFNLSSPITSFNATVLS